MVIILDRITVSNTTIKIVMITSIIRMIYDIYRKQKNKHNHNNSNDKNNNHNSQKINKNKNINTYFLKKRSNNNKKS
jgi:predicted histidine transporter YuiF (NhaC family)